MNPTPAAISVIRSRVADWTPTDQAIADTLNAQTAPNPAAQGTTAKPLTLPDLLGQVGPTDAGKLATNPNLPTIITDIAAQDRVSIGEWVPPLEAAGELTAGEAAAIDADLAATEPDPAWQAEIPWTVATLGRLLDAEDIDAARPTGGA